MAYSLPEGKVLIARWIKHHPDIKSVVDLGAGSGTYYKLLKNIRPDLFFTAVEIWMPNIIEFELEKKYDTVIIGDIRNMEFPDADCCIAGDILEHLEKKDTIRVFKKLDKKYKYVIISMPLNMPGEEAFLGNPHERHLSMWTFNEICGLIGGKYKIQKKYQKLGVFIK